MRRFLADSPLALHGLRLDFKDRDFLDITDFSRDELEHLFLVSDHMTRYLRNSIDTLHGKLMASLFFEPSTRTRLSFEAAMKRLGGDAIGFADPAGSSYAKGETLVDTIRMVENYVDVIVLRHPAEGSAKIAAQITDLPVINAGSGALSHPSQALLDLYTIRREHGSIDGLKVAMVGDLKYGRTVHSLAYGLSLYKVKLMLVSPGTLRMRPEILEDLDQRNLPVEQFSRIEEVLPEADVLYMTRIQKERFPDPLEFEQVRSVYKLTPELLVNAKRDMIVLHPLPRVDEIDPRVDEDPHSRYFKQAQYGVITRMALLSLIFGVEEKP